MARQATLSVGVSTVRVTDREPLFDSRTGLLWWADKRVYVNDKGGVIIAMM